MSKETKNNQTESHAPLSGVSSRTMLELQQEWSAPTHFSPKGIIGSVKYFAELCGLSEKIFIEKYNEGIYSQWFAEYES